MRIMSPPKFIMNISLIMRLIIALIVFQCAQRVTRSARRLCPASHPLTYPSPHARAALADCGLATALVTVRPTATHLRTEQASSGQREVPRGGPPYRPRLAARPAHACTRRKVQSAVRLLLSAET